MKNWFLVFENKFITFLTSICWWIDLHFDLKSKKIAEVSFLLFFNISYYLYFDYKDYFEIILYLITNLLFSFICILYFRSMPPLAEMYKNSVLNPNPNRQSGVKSIVYIALFLLPIIIRSVSVVIYPIGLFIWYYILCTEPMPPKEKVARKEKNEMRKMQLSGSS